MNISWKTIVATILAACLLSGEAIAKTGETHARFSIAISGGASKGAYEAGLNWGIIKLLRETTDQKKIMGGTFFPFEASSISGASAGGINTILSGLTWCSLPEKDGGIYNRINANIFRDIWLRVDINTLLPESADSPSYLPDDAVLSRKDFLEAANELRDKWTAPNFRKGCRIPLGVTVTRIEPDTLAVGSVEVMNQRFYIPFELRVTDDRSIEYFFDPSDYPKLSDPAMILMPRTPSAAPYYIDNKYVIDAAFTTSAFPMAFGRKRLQYCSLVQQDITGEAENQESLTTEIDTDLECPDGYVLQEAEFADGGLFDNLPIGVARTLAEQHKNAKTNSQPLTYMYIDPNRIRYHIPEVEERLACDSAEPPEACDVMEFSAASESKLLVGFLGTARNYELYRELTSDAWQLNMSEISYKFAEILKQREIVLDCQKELPYFDRNLNCTEALERAGHLLEIAYDRINPVIDKPYSIKKLRKAEIIDSCKPLYNKPDTQDQNSCAFDTQRYRTQLADAILSLVEKAQLTQIKIYSDIKKSRLSVGNDRILRVSSRGAPITGTLLEDFGSFLDYKFREYDYYVGVYDSIVLVTNKLCRLQYSSIKQATNFHQCFDTTSKQLYSILGFDTDPRGRYAFARLAQREYGKEQLMRFSYQPMPAVEEDIRIIHEGLEKALAAGESEQVFFNHIKSQGFVPTRSKSVSKHRLIRFIQDDDKTLLEQIIEDPDSWGTELTRRVTTRLVYLETQADEIYTAREPDKNKRESAHTQIIGATAFVLQSSNYRYPESTFAPSTAPENWFWRNLIPYEIGFDFAEGDLLLTWQPTWALSQENLLGIRGTLGFPGGLFQSSADVTRDNYLAVGLDYTRKSSSPYISSYGVTPTWYHSFDQPENLDRDTLGGDVHIGILKNRLRLGVGVRNFDRASDTWFFTLGITDMPGIFYWLSR